MSEQAQATDAKTNEKPAKPKREAGTPVGRMSLSEVDAKLGECDKAVKTHTDTVKSKLASGAAIPPAALRELSKANAMKNKLVMRRIVLLMESGDAGAGDLLDKILRIKPAKA